MRNNPKLRKALTMILCAVALVAISVGATLAYLTDTQKVNNTFTVGHVDIELTEAKTNAKGQPLDGDEVVTDVDQADRITGNNDGTVGNTYHLLPGQSYTKDPKITIKKGSEDCFIAAKIVVSGVAEGCPLIMDNNDLLGIKDVVTGGVFDDQDYRFTANPCTWESDEIKLTQEKIGNNYVFMVYYKEVQEKIEANSEDDAIELTIFNNITIPSAWDNDDIQTLKELKIEVAAYAMQAAGFEDKGVEEAYKACLDTGFEGYTHNA